MYWLRAHSTAKLWWKQSSLRPEGHKGPGVLIRTRDADAFYLCAESHRAEEDIQLESVAPADDDVLAVYQYLIGSEGGGE